MKKEKGKECSFSINCTGTIRYPYEEKVKIDPYFMPYAKIDSKLIIDLRNKIKKTF